MPTAMATATNAMNDSARNDADVIVSMFFDGVGAGDFTGVLGSGDGTATPGGGDGCGAATGDGCDAAGFGGIGVEAGRGGAGDAMVQLIPSQWKMVAFS